MSWVQIPTTTGGLRFLLTLNPTVRGDLVMRGRYFNRLPVCVFLWESDPTTFGGVPLVFPLKPPKGRQTHMKVWPYRQASLPPMLHKNCEMFGADLNQCLAYVVKTVMQAQ